MMTRSIVGRFLILAVLLVSLGVIAQAALIITKGSGKAVAKANAAAAPGTAAVAATPASAPASPAGQQAAVADPAPIRVVYPGPLGDTPIQPRKFVASASATPATAPTTVAAPVPVTAPAAPPAPQPVVAVVAPALPPAAAPAPVKPAPVVIASADADAPSTPDGAPTGKGGVNLNSASVEALNHLGGGHIGQSIVQHRPYGSVEDLMRKRVVRRSVYEQIKNEVAAR